MENPYGAYIDLLMEIKGGMEQLSILAQRKIDAVRSDDLILLDEIMKQEQAIALTLRGQEQRRATMLSGMGLDGVPLSGLSDNYPDDMRLQAKRTSEDLLREYDVYRNISEIARNTLECNLHEIEKLLAEAGGEVPVNVGYAQPNIEPPAPMKTDFRA